MTNANMKKFLILAVLAVAAAATFAQIMRRPGGMLRPGGLRRPGAPAAQPPAEEAKPIAEQLKEIPKGTNGVPILNFENAPLDLVLMQYATLSEKILLPAPNLPKTQITLMSNGRELDKESYLEAIEVALVMNGVVIEEGAIVRKAIIAENTVVGKNVRIGEGNFEQSRLDPKVYNSDIAVIGANSVIPEGVSVGKNTAISGKTELADYPEGILPSGGYILKKEGKR